MIEGGPEYRQMVAQQIGMFCREGEIAQLMARALAIFPTTALPPLCLHVIYHADQVIEKSPIIGLFPGRTVFTRTHLTLVRTLIYPITIGGLS